jgi:hypothetical protein
VSDEDGRIHCATHGPSSDGALVCRHLASGSAAQGFFYEYPEEDPDATCPDAWCQACENLLEKEGGWNEAAMQHAGLRVVCDECFRQIRARNWVQDDEALHELIRESVAYLEDKQGSMCRDFKLGEHKRYDWDQDRAQLVFSNDGKAAVICDVVFVGSLSTKTNTWLWSWANRSIQEGAKGRMREVREYGEENDFEHLAAAYWDATEEDGWEMTAIAARMLGAIGAYRSPDKNGLLFMVITDARWAQ